MAAPERALLPVDGFDSLTEAYTLFLAASASSGASPSSRAATDGPPDAAADADTTVVLFPGNPGIAGSYSLLLQRLRDEWASSGPLRASGSTRFVAVSYAGHVYVRPDEQAAAAAAAGEAAAAAGGDKSSNSSAAGSGRHSLERQVEHKVQFLRQHVLPRTRAGGALLIVGHSIGAHMAVEAALRLQEEQEEKQDEAAAQEARGRQGAPPPPPPPPLRIAAALLTPFLSTNPPCPRQRAVRRLANLHAPAGWAAALAGRLLGALPLPESAHLRLASWASGADHAYACRAIAGLLQPGVVDSALFLAKSEFERLPQGVSGLPLIEIEGVGEVLLVGGPDDMWWPEAHHRAVERRFEAAAAQQQGASGGGAGGGGANEGGGPGGGGGSPGLVAVWDPRVSHLFGCVAHETVAVAAHVARYWAARVSGG